MSHGVHAVQHGVEHQIEKEEHGHGGRGKPVGESRNKKIALLISVIALFLALAEMFGKSAQTEGISLNIKASDAWNFFQAKTIRQTTLRTAAQALALDFKVSRVVILRRLLATGLIPSSLYNAKTKTWEEELTPVRKGTGRFSLSTTIKKNGTTFSGLVVEAFQKNKISYAGASDYLGVKTKHLRKLEKLINIHAAG